MTSPVPSVSIGGDSFVPYVDEALYLAHTQGQQAVVQGLYYYRRPVDLDALRRFHAHLEHSLLGRLIRPATLPFGRAHWVTAPGSPLDLCERELPPSALRAWADAEVDRPLDPARGPGWRLSLQPFTDGSTAISLVVSHCIADGMAAIAAISEATRGERRSRHYPSGQPTRPLQSALEELRRFTADLPDIARGLRQLLVVGARMAQSRAGARTPAPAPARTAGLAPATVVLPSMSFSVDATTWKRSARERGVNRATVLAALTAAFAARLGRTRRDAVLVLLPFNTRRNAADAGANRVALASMRVAISSLDGPLRLLQDALRDARERAMSGPDELSTLASLVPFLPARLLAPALRLALDSADLPVTCSYLGTLPPATSRIDGADADWYFPRGVDRCLEVRDIEARRGLATVFASTVPERLILTFVAYQPGVVTSPGELRALVEPLLATFGLPAQCLYD